MTVTRKLLPVAALAAAGIGLVAPTSAWADDDPRGLVNVTDNNVGPFQVCHNDVPVNVIGGQVPVNDVLATLGLLSESSGNTASQSKTCEQPTEQNH